MIISRRGIGPAVAGIFAALTLFCPSIEIALPGDDDLSVLLRLGYFASEPSGPELVDEGRTLVSPRPPAVIVDNRDPMHKPARIAVPQSMQSLESATATFTITYVASGGTDAWGEPCQTYPTAARTAFEAVVPQTFGSSVNTHPHVHAIASRGGWATDGTWVPIPYVDSGAAALLFRHKVLRLLLDAELIDEDRVELIRGWRHPSGFSVHNQVVVDAGDDEGLVRLARYLARPPVSLQRMEWAARPARWFTGPGAGTPRRVGTRRMTPGMRSSGSTSWSSSRAW